MRNPNAKNVLPKNLTPAEILDAEEKQTERLATAIESWKMKVDAIRPNLCPVIEEGKRNPVSFHQKTEASRQALRQQSVASRLAQPARDQERAQKAAQLGVPLEVVQPSGQKLLFTGEVAGGARYVASDNFVAAAGISADELWPIAKAPLSNHSTGLDLTGAGQTVGQWEIDGGVRTSHTEFGSRITQKDGASVDTSGHATQVCGTISARGASGADAARGIAFECDVFSYDFFFFKPEREAAAAGNINDPALMVSNHSWGSVDGFGKETVFGVPNQWVWRGPTATSFQEDPKFGLYTANSLDEDGCTQVDQFHNSEAPNHLMIYSAGNDRLEGIGSLSTYWIPSGGTFISQNGFVFPRDWDDGDEGGYDSVGSPGTAKNVLTVGSCKDIFNDNGVTTELGFGSNTAAVASAFSAAGPTDDGRIKPDLAAVGDINSSLRIALGQSVTGLVTPSSGSNTNYSIQSLGTSFAVPAATGALALVLERRLELYPGLTESDALLNSTLKGLLINTCDDVDSPGPDYRLGHGVLNAENAVLAVGEDHSVGRGSLIKEFTLDNAETFSWIVVSDGTEPFSATLAWSDLPGPAITNVTTDDAQNAMLVNNLDVSIEHLDSSTTYHPWILDPDLNNETSAARSAAATRGIDNRNNVENISITSPTAGRYRVTVTHSGGPVGNPAPTSQDVSLILSGSVPEMGSITDLQVAPTANQFLLSFNADPGAYFEIETSLDLQNWTVAQTVLATDVTNTTLVDTLSSNPKRFWRLKRAQ